MIVCVIDQKTTVVSTNRITSEKFGADYCQKWAWRCSNLLQAWLQKLAWWPFHILNRSVGHNQPKKATWQKIDDHQRLIWHHCKLYCTFSKLEDSRKNHFKIILNFSTKEIVVFWSCVALLHQSRQEARM